VKEATIKIVDEFAQPVAPMPYSKKKRTLSLKVEHLKLQVMFISQRMQLRG
jgi:hypothetical protein